MEIIIGFATLAFIIWFIYTITKNTANQISSLSDHYHCANPSRLRADAVVVDVYSEQVEYYRNLAKFKTTVRFSDGFEYTSHETKRENHFGSYTITVDAETKARIIARAKNKHDQVMRGK